MTPSDLGIALALTRPDWAKDAYQHIYLPGAAKYPAKPTRLRVRRKR